MTDFDAVTRDLVAAIQHGDAVAFVGAGVSATAGLPTWDAFTEELRAQLTPPTQILSIELIAQFFRNQYGERELIRRLRAYFAIAGLRPTLVHSSLAALPINVFITTNYDNLLEDALRSRPKPLHVICDDAELSQWNEAGETQLIKLHGDLDRASTIVFTSEDYSRFLHSNSELQKKLHDVLSFRTVVFCGYSLRDIDVTLVLDKLSLVYGRLKPTAFVITQETDIHLHREWERRGVRAVVVGETLGASMTERLATYLHSITRAIEPAPVKPDILIVDDDLPLRGMVASALKQNFRDASIRLAGDGLEACHAIGKRQPDVILLDLMMPKMNGYEFLQFVRGKPEYASLNIIVISAYLKADQSELRKLGVRAIVPKPFDLPELVGLITTLSPAFAAHVK